MEEVKRKDQWSICFVCLSAVPHLLRIRCGQKINWKMHFGVKMDALPHCLQAMQSIPATTSLKTMIQTNEPVVPACRHSVYVLL